MKFDKLVRDKIPEIIRAKKQIPVTHVAGDDEYWEKLKDKLAEEVNEFRESGDIEELADIIEVIEALSGAKGSSLQEVERVRQKKADERGKFLEKIILEEVK